jgi:hypothetical protein
LAEDALFPAELHDLPHCKEVPAVFELVNQLELSLELSVDFAWNSPLVSGGSALHSNVLEPTRGGVTLGYSLRRVPILDFVQRKLAAICNLAGLLEKRWCIGVDLGELLRRVEPVLGVWMQTAAGLV